MTAPVKVAESLGLNHRVIETAEVERADYRANNSSRCYFCKDELYIRLGLLAAEEGYAHVVNGANVDDLGDFRPGSEGRGEVRRPESHGRGRPHQNRGPGAFQGDEAANVGQASPGLPVVPDTLRHRPSLRRRSPQSRRLRTSFAASACRQLRVRHHDTMARIEVEPEDLPLMVSEEVRESVSDYFRSIGYAYVTLDLAGFRSGSLNEVLPSGGRRRS